MRTWRSRTLAHMPERSSRECACVGFLFQSMEPISDHINWCEWTKRRRGTAWERELDCGPIDRCHTFDDNYFYCLTLMHISHNERCDIHIKENDTPYNVAEHNENERKRKKNNTNGQLCLNQNITLNERREKNAKIIFIKPKQVLSTAFLLHSIQIIDAKTKVAMKVKFSFCAEIVKRCVCVCVCYAVWINFLLLLFWVDITVFCAYTQICTRTRALLPSECNRSHWTGVFSPFL